MKKPIRNLMLLGAATLFACSNPEPMAPEQASTPASESQSHFVNADEALTRLESALHAFIPETRSIPAFGPVQPIGIATRAEASGPAGYVVNFEDGGYAILSADDRKPAVVAFSEHGSLSAEAFEEDFRHTADHSDEVSTPAYINALIRNYLTTPATGNAALTRSGESAIVEEQTAFMRTKWTDAPPYNSFIPGRGVAGAPNIALAQILLYNHKHHGVGLDKMNVWIPAAGRTYNPDWSLLDLAAHYDNVPSESSNGVEAGRFTAAIAIANGTQFHGNQSQTSIQNIQTFLTDFWGYRMAQIKPFETTTMANLKRVMRTLLYVDKMPVYIQGDSMNVFNFNHAWIADGWMVLAANGTHSSYIHCNFCVGYQYDLWLLFESNTPFSVLFPVGSSDETLNFDTDVQMIDYML